MIDAVIRMLREWRRWLLTHEAGIGPEPVHLGSAEAHWADYGRQRGEQEARPAMRMEPDEHASMAIERAVRALPEDARRVVRVEYVEAWWRRPEEDAEQHAERKRRMALVPSWRYDELLDDAHRTIAANPEVRRHADRFQ